MSHGPTNSRDNCGFTALRPVTIIVPMVWYREWCRATPSCFNFISLFQEILFFRKIKKAKIKKMNKELIFTLFERTSKYRQPKKESLNELKACYEHYSLEYISAPDFLKELNNMGFQSNKYGDVKLRMKRDVHKAYFGSG